MIPWLLVAELMSAEGRPLSDLVESRVARYPASGEINLELDDPAEALRRLREEYGSRALSVDDIDGVSLEFKDWRVNVRMSNTEPVVRVNVESRGDRALMERKTDEVLEALRGYGKHSVEA